MRNGWRAGQDAFKVLKKNQEFIFTCKISMGSFAKSHIALDHFERLQQ